MIPLSSLQMGVTHVTPSVHDSLLNRIRSRVREERGEENETDGQNIQ